MSTTVDATSVRRPAARGAALVLLAVGLRRISTPPVQHAVRGIGLFATSALRYGGAALIGALLRGPAAREAALHRRDLPRLAGMAYFGAGVGPVALACGLAAARAR